MEVEAALARHPSVAQAAVVIRTIGGEDRLVAYVVVAPGFLFEARTLKSFAKDVLPTHLRPALFVSIDAMPKTTSGKVDLNALLEPIDHVESRPIPPVTEVQKRLARIWNEVLGIGQVSLTDNLFERGGSSLSAIKVYLRINEEFSIDLPFRLIIEAADLATLASEIEAAVAKAAARRGTVYLAGSVRPAEPSADYDQETKLDLSLQALPGPIAPFTEVDTVVVTGVTGFLGAFTARSLLERTKARVFCPVRARSVEEARIRVEQVLAASGVRSREFLDRVFSFCGDLSRPGLGLSSVDYERIATEADAVFHCGRMSNFILPYASHRAVNVTATRDVLRLAATTRSKAVHFASTLTVGGALQHGYGQSRWVAEQLVKGAHERGFGVAVYRAGRLAGDTRTGAFPSGQFIGALLKGCIELGCVPKFKDLKVDLTPADYIGECMVALACLPDALGKAFTVCHPELTEWDAIVDGLRRFGYSLRASDLTTWLDGLRMRLDQSALAPYWPVLEGWRRSGEIVAPDNFPVDALETIDAGTVQRMVEPAGIVCPRIDERVLGRYLTELVRTGYLAPPAAARHDAKIKRNESARSNGR
jgi:thioester reductase-like protein